VKNIKVKIKIEKKNKLILRSMIFLFDKYVAKVILHIKNGSVSLLFSEKEFILKSK
jgi:hypothetical protein